MDMVLKIFSRSHDSRYSDTIAFLRSAFAFTNKNLFRLVMEKAADV